VNYLTTKAMKIVQQDCATPGALSQWKTDTSKRIVLLTNNTNQDVRIDKLMMTVSAFGNNTATGGWQGLHTMVHMSDSLGNYIDSTNWAYTTAQMETQCQQNKEKIWMNDCRIIGQGGSSQQLVTYFELEANTSRLLAPGQSLAISFANCQNTGTLANGPTVLIDLMFWYS